MAVSTYVKNMELLSYLRILYPTAFHFKEERVLATHPLSYHPQRCLASEKRKENERKWKKMKRSGN